MRQENGTDLLGANDPRGATIGVIYVSANDDRKSVLAAILTQEKLGREQVAVVLPPNQQNKAFQRPGDFDDLKAMRRKLKAQIIFIAPSGPGPAELARQRRFPVYSSTESYVNALRVDSQIQGAAKKGWLFGSPGAKSATPVPPVAPLRSRSSRHMPTAPLPPAPSHGARRDFNEDEYDDGNVSPFVAGAAGAAIGGGAVMAYDRMHDHQPVHSDDMEYDNPATPDAYDEPPSDPSSQDFDDADDLGPPSTPMPAAVPEDIAGSTQAIPMSRSNANPDIGDSPVINLRSRPSKGRATLPLTPREPDPVPETPRQTRSSRVLPAALAGGALAGAAAASVAAPTRNPASGRTVPATGAGMNTAAARPGRFGGLPPRGIPPGRGGGGAGAGRGPANRRGLLIGLILLLLALLLCGGGYMVFAQPTSSVGRSVRNAFGIPSSGTVTITPDSKPISDKYTLAGANTTDAAARTVATRQIAATAQSAPVQVNATGHKQPASTAARGTLTFFNSLGSARQLPVGQVVNAGGGVTIVTDEIAFMQASNGAFNGSATVKAHAVPTGPSGNIGAFTFSATGCCADHITVSNSAAFTGGQNLPPYSFLQQSDVTSVVTQQIKDTTKQDAMSNLSKQLHTGEQPFGATQCAPVISADQALGDNGANNPVSNANVTYRIKCTSNAYDNAGAQNVVSGLLAQKAATSLPRGYTPVNNIQVSLTNQITTNNTTSFFFSGSGVWTYQFTDQQKLNIAKSIAGKTVAEAQAILKNTPGVGSATVTVGSGNNLPSDPNQLSIQTQPLTASVPAASVVTPTLSPPNVADPIVQGGGGGGAK